MELTPKTGSPRDTAMKNTLARPPKSRVTQSPPPKLVSRDWVEGDTPRISANILIDTEIIWRVQDELKAGNEDNVQQLISDIVAAIHRPLSMAILDLTGRPEVTTTIAVEFDLAKDS
jgi:hypothetical protein